MSGQIFAEALPAVIEFTSPRAWAFSLLGIHEYLQRLSGDRTASQIRDTLTARLMDLFDRTAQPDWPWFEDVLSYDNAKLAHALIVSGQSDGARAGVGAGTADVALAGGNANRRKWRLPPDRQQRISSARRSAGDVRPATHRSAGHGVGLPRSLSGHVGRVVVRSRPSGRSIGFSAGTIWAWKCTRPARVAAAMRCTWTASTKTRARNRPWRSCCRWRKCNSCKTPSPLSTSRFRRHDH